MGVPERSGRHSSGAQKLRESSGVAHVLRRFFGCCANFAPCFWGRCKFCATITSLSVLCWGWGWGAKFAFYLAFWLQNLRVALLVGAKFASLVAIEKDRVKVAHVSHVYLTKIANALEGKRSAGCAQD